MTKIILNDFPIYYSKAVYHRYGRRTYGRVVQHRSCFGRPDHAIQIEKQRGKEIEIRSSGSLLAISERQKNREIGNLLPVRRQSALAYKSVTTGAILGQ